MFKKLGLLLVLTITSCSLSVAQETDKVTSQPLDLIVNDSVIFKQLDDINIYPRKGRKLNYRRYSRIVAKVRKVYPFAKDAAAELAKYNELYENSTSQKEKRKYIRAVEKELYEKYEDKLRRFTVTEGRYLMLLIDRETGDSSFELIKELKGGMPASFWQGIAKIFKNDLKQRYDPVYKHYVIEQIVIMIEHENNVIDSKKSE